MTLALMRRTSVLCLMVGRLLPCVRPDGTWFYTAREYDRASTLDGQSFLPLGKHRAGRMLDGRTWDQMPGGAA